MLLVCYRAVYVIGNVPVLLCVVVVFFFQAEDGIRDLVRSRGLGDVCKRQLVEPAVVMPITSLSLSNIGPPESPGTALALVWILSLIHI